MGAFSSRPTSDGAIRWRRADDGRELLTLQVLPNKEDEPAKWDWVLWTPEGFYDAPGAKRRAEMGRQPRP